MKTWGLVRLVGLLVVLSILGLAVVVPAMADHETVQICDIDGSCGLIAVELLEPVVFDEPVATVAAEETIAEVAAIPEPLEFLSPEGILMVRLCDPNDDMCSVVPASLLEPVAVEATVEEPAAEIASYEDLFAEHMALLESLGLMCELATGECISLAGETQAQVTSEIEAEVAAVETTEVEMSPEMFAEFAPLY